MDFPFVEKIILALMESSHAYITLHTYMHTYCNFFVASIKTNSE